MLNELRTFIALAQTGSVHRAANRVFITPSAVTRQIQRLEAALGATLLDRRVKPPRLTPLGRSVLERGRELLRLSEELKAHASPEAEPTGTFQLGVSHALARPSLAGPIQSLRQRFPRLGLSLRSDVTSNLLEQVRAGDMTAAVVMLPAGGTVPGGLACALIAREKFVVVRARAGQSTDIARHAADPWVLNPAGCLVRESLRAWLERSGISLKTAAEAHDLELQLSLVSAGAGLGLLPQSYLKRLPARRRPAIVRGWELSVSIALARATHIGPHEAAADFLEARLRDTW